MYFGGKGKNVDGYYVIQSAHWYNMLQGNPATTLQKTMHVFAVN
jgi:hypothetical protein